MTLPIFLHLSHNIVGIAAFGSHNSCNYNAFNGKVQDGEGQKLMINNINIHQPKTKAVVIRKKIISFIISQLLLQLFPIASPSYYSNTLLSQSVTWFYNPTIVNSCRVIRCTKA